MNINQKAIELLENNEYEEAFKLFQEAVKESRNIQSLNNLAWIYYHEEGDKETAFELIKEAISLNPSSYFPYNLLGEIYIEREEWQNAVDTLLKSITIHPSIEAFNNLGVAKYHLGEWQEASYYFLRSSQDSDYGMYSHVKCLIELGKTTEAKSKLDAFSEEDDEFVGAVEVAELYVALSCFEEAIKWFEKGWKAYWKQPDWVSQYLYLLLKTNRMTQALEIQNEVIQEKNKEIKEAYEDVCDEDWTEEDREEHIKQLLQDKNEYEDMIDRIISGHIPVMNFNTSMSKGCYLFGCKRHNHPEYQG